MLDDVPGALWQQRKLDDSRITEANMPPLQRIVVGVDPQAAKPADSAVDYEEGHAGVSGSETGIIVAGLGEDGHGYVLHDCSGDLLPSAWAQRTIGAYEQFSGRPDRARAQQRRGHGGEHADHDQQPASCAQCMGLARQDHPRRADLSVVCARHGAPRG